MSIDFKKKDEIKNIAKAVVEKDTKIVKDVLEKELEKSVEESQVTNADRRANIMDKVKDKPLAIQEFYSRFCKLTIGDDESTDDTFSMQMQNIVNDFQKISDGSMTPEDIARNREAHVAHAERLSGARSECRVIRDGLLDIKRDAMKYPDCMDRRDILFLLDATVKTYNQMTGLGKFENFHKCIMGVLDGVDAGYIKPKFYLMNAAERYIRSMGDMYGLPPHVVVSMIANNIGDVLGLKDGDRIGEEMDHGFLIGLMTCINNIKLGRDSFNNEPTFTYDKFSNVKGKNKTTIKMIVSMYLSNPLYKKYRSEFVLKIKEMSVAGKFKEAK